MSEPTEPIVKTCQCCGRTFTIEQWRTLQYVGIQADDVERIEMRNCDCRPHLGMPPTLAIAVDDNGDPVPDSPS